MLGPVQLQQGLVALKWNFTSLSMQHGRELLLKANALLAVTKLRITGMWALWPYSHLKFRGSIIFINYSENTTT